MFDIVIKTFDRYNCLDKLLKSIEKFYPETSVIVADDSINFRKNFYGKYNLDITVLNLGVDVGLSYGRNEAVKHCTEDYIVLLDDDFILDKRTKLENLVTVAKEVDADVVGASLDTNGKIDGYNQLLEIRGDVLRYYEIPEDFKEVEGLRYQKFDLVYNFALFKRSIFERVQWDNNIKIKGEHVDFFLEAKKLDLKVYYCPDTIIKHKQIRTREYSFFRQRNDGYYYLFKKWNIKKIINASGQVCEIKNKELNFYRQPV